MAREWIANINSVCEKLVMESINVPESQQQETHDPLDTLTERDVEQILDGRTCADCGAPGLFPCFLFPPFLLCF